MGAQTQSKRRAKWIPNRDKEIARTVQRLHAEWDDSTFAGRLKLVRAHAGDLTVNKAANLCDFNVQSWSNWEAGGHVRDLEGTVRAIVQTFGCDGDWLLRGVDKILYFAQQSLWPHVVKDVG